uniref:Uncharacterized protein n=1 Tax=Aplanochytrium stocchinoi TaxID=215587 RepID=A0A7S3LHW7_9STRA|mmetsp:Transcript_471/g.554  ORF Transcript_471/g.554 Transcript_471/m.554 type:complete len:375 (-) Transcript_471:1049-2173(-)|eukprot:CAMPEP_0204824220 /NCGR_PEP_ID=MMETSP1346-20131115/2253_1 /ASSEMBLY_ACC=CAM_ASM_000771 /TAXON_ID=215587 /ORGANISM="Aplanochytrium stocchinoi, Strain GSBS06" /LENGTH=374 /DNA_ID=CAMNT_0051951247 /DNA_START=238 /DNA_END=1362 /DNA_ORIENTATION=+
MMSAKRKIENHLTEPKLETRARRRLELIELRHENERLKDERTQFLEKIAELESTVNRNVGETEEDCKMKTENEILRTELKIHKSLMAKFGELLRATPEKVNAEHTLLREGADSAHNLVLGLFSQSQTKWAPLKPPPRLKMDVADCHLCYLFEDELFGEKTGNDARLNIRADCLLKNVRLGSVSCTLWNWFCQHQTMIKMYHLDESQLDLKSIKGTLPDEDIKVVRFRRKFENKQHNQDVVFICNRRKRTLARSTLTPPQGKKTSIEEFGKVNATIISAMSTSIYCNIPRSEDDPNVMKVVKGGIIWQEGDDVRMSVLYSVPDRFRVGIQDRLVGQIVTEKGRMTKGLASVLQSTTNMFASLVQNIQKDGIGNEN